MLAFVEGLMVEDITVLEHVLKRLQEDQWIMRDFVINLEFFGNISILGKLSNSVWATLNVA